MSTGSPDDRDGVDSGMLEDARFAYDVQSRQLERSTNAAQGLLTAVTLLAALGAPLLLPPPDDGWLELVVGLLLVGYLLALGLSLRHSLSVLATNPRRMTKPTVARGFLFYRDIAAYPSADVFGQDFRSAMTTDQLTYVLDQVYVLGSLVVVKSDHVVKAIKWLIRGMALFAAALVLNYLARAAE